VCYLRKSQHASVAGQVPGCKAQHCVESSTKHTYLWQANQQPRALVQATTYPWHPLNKSQHTIVAGQEAKCKAQHGVQSTYLMQSRDQPCGPARATTSPWKQLHKSQHTHVAGQVHGFKAQHLRSTANTNIPVASIGASTCPCGGNNLPMAPAAQVTAHKCCRSGG
jgi:hypothetical protein